MFWNFILSILSTAMIIMAIFVLKSMIVKLNNRNMISENKRERFKLNLKATMLHIIVLIIAILASFFQIFYVIGQYSSEKANTWSTRLGTIDLCLQALISVIVCYVCWFLTQKPATKR